MARILIAGCGDVGTTLGRSLSAAGHEVWGLKRHPADLPPGIQPLAADLTDPATLNALPPALDAVVYSAAAAGFGEAAYRAAYVAGVQQPARTPCAGRASNPTGCCLPPAPRSTPSIRASGWTRIRPPRPRASAGAAFAPASG